MQGSSRSRQVTSFPGEHADHLGANPTTGGSSARHAPIRASPSPFCSAPAIATTQPRHEAGRRQLAGIVPSCRRRDGRRRDDLDWSAPRLIKRSY